MLLVLTVTMGVSAMDGAGSFASDSFATPSGKLATLAIQLGNFKIHVDPQTRYTDYTKWEKADLILITHEHGDHLDMNAIKALSGPLDVAFLPMNQPYTMTPEQVAEVVRLIRPKIVYPYRYSSTNPRDLEKLLEKDTYTEVRIRKF
ncbi:MBL fold metallo-hydrolase [Gracilinema caldarium]|nr:MBL fold metallo-hydrolase [Gracilinema caldarium]